MKTKILLFIILISTANIFSQTPSGDVIKRAMKDELQRSMSKLTLENLKNPFFISYTIVDAKKLSIQASLGALINSDEKPFRSQSVKVLVGDYNLDNENFIDMNSGSFMSQFGDKGDLPLDDDYYGIRRSLWLATDEKYKSAAESFEAKLSAMKQQNLTSEDSLPDLVKVKPTVLQVNPKRQFEINKSKWENIAKELSSILKNYKEIFSSSVSVNLYNSTIYFVNSEGTETVQPMTIAGVQINASTMAQDGAPLSDHVLYYESNPLDLPTPEKMKGDVKAMADNLLALRNAPVFDESYSGPVLFEDQAAAEVFSQRLLSSNGGIVSSRKGIYSNPQVLMFMSQGKDKAMEDKIDKKIVSTTLTVKAQPKMSTFEGKNLIGSYEVDAEGVAPDNDLVLIQKGILKTMLNGRTPNQNVKQSNGHYGYKLGQSMLLEGTGPSVITVSSTETEPKADIKKQLIEKAKEEGLKYTYIVRKVKCSNSGASEGLDMSSIMSFAGDMQKKGGLSSPIAIYRLSTETGKEELVRGANISGLTVASLKKLIGTSDKQYVYNTLHPEGYGGISSILSFAFSIGGGSGALSGKPATFIVPDAILLEELDIQKEKRAITSKLPVVENPVGR